jgi:hypothetical protein
MNRNIMRIPTHSVKKYSSRTKREECELSTCQA